jgi:hypothetical protein
VAASFYLAVTSGLDNQLNPVDDCGVFAPSEAQDFCVEVRELQATEIIILLAKS